MSATGSSVYAKDKASLDSDQPRPLYHGIIRYVPGENVDSTLKKILPVKNDHVFVYVPAGYLSGQPKFMKKILDAADLEIPPLAVVTAESEGTPEEMVSGFEIQNKNEYRFAKKWTLDHCKEVLNTRVEEILSATMESCMEVGAWVMPETPRRNNGAAQLLSRAIAPGMSVTSVGLIGLTDEDEEEGLKQSLEDTMVPAGTPVEQVTSIVYDPSVSDNAPCPGLSKFIIFESPHELLIWRESLLSVVPDLLLLFGNITASAMDTIYDNSIAGSPIIVLKHTGKKIDNACKMLKHVKKHIKTVAQKDSNLPTAAQPGPSTDAGLSDPPKKAKAKKVVIPAMQDMPDEKINIYVSTWPADFNPASVVVADPLILTGKTFQKRMLRAITASFDLKKGSEDIRKAKKRALDYAWSFHDVAKRQTAAKKRESEILHGQLVFFTLAAVSAAVLYNKYFIAAHSSSGPLQIVVFVLTIILPLYVTSLKQESDKNNPAVRWRAFKIAAAKMESEIFRFRCQVEEYRAEEKTESSMRKPLTSFSQNTAAIWATVRPQLADDEMGIPGDFWEETSPVGALAKVADVVHGVREAVTADAGNVQADIEAGPPNVSTPLLGDEKAASDDHEDDDDDDEPSQAESGDNHYSPMTADDYIELRMKKVMQAKNSELKVAVSRNEKISFAIKLVTILSGATAALSLQWVVPIVLGFTAFLGAGQEFRKYRQRIELGNEMVAELNHLKLWWMGLSMYQKQLPMNKDKLIRETEHAIIHEISAVSVGKGD